MFDLDKWQEIFYTLRRNPLRTLLTGLGIFWGIFMLILMLGVGNGLEDGVNKDMGRRASNSFFTWTQRTTKPYKGFQPGRSFNMNNDDYQALKHQLPEALYICPRNQLGGHKGSNNVTYNGQAGAFQVTGDYPDIQHIEMLQVYEGRFLNPKDNEGTRKVAVIGLGVVEVLFPEGNNPIGEHIQINGTNFQVVGLFKSAQSGERGEEETQRIYVPFTTFQKSFNYGTFVSWFAISAYPRGDAIALEEKTLAILKDRHTIAPDDERAFGHWNMARQFREIENVFFGINALSWIVGTLTLLAGAIGISNIMLVVVKERTKEIGIRRAIGATPFSIVSLIVAESIFLTVLAGYLGLLLGFGILETYAYLKESIGFDTGMFGIPNLELGLAIQALLILVVAGIFAGLLPAYRAISIPPVDALRTD